MTQIARGLLSLGLIGISAHADTYVSQGAGVCADTQGNRIQYCQKSGITVADCKAKCDSMSTCTGYNGDTHQINYPPYGVCFIHYGGVWDGAGWENQGCHNTGNGNIITGQDGREGGTCYKKDPTKNVFMNLYDKQRVGTDEYTAMGSGVCSAGDTRVSYCQNQGYTEAQCSAKCDSLSNCLGYNPTTHQNHYPDTGGSCFIFYSGTWDGAGFENGGCHSAGNGVTITGNDGLEGGMCYRKDSGVTKKLGPTSTTATTTPGPAFTSEASQTTKPAEPTKAAVEISEAPTKNAAAPPTTIAAVGVTEPPTTTQLPTGVEPKTATIATAEEGAASESAAFRGGGLTVLFLIAVLLLQRLFN